MIIQMLRPILTNFISQMNDEEIDKLIVIIKAIIKYLEEDEEGENNEKKKAVSFV